MSRDNVPSPNKADIPDKKGVDQNKMAVNSLIKHPTNEDLDHAAAVMCMANKGKKPDKIPMPETFGDPGNDGIEFTPDELAGITEENKANHQT